MLSGTVNMVFRLNEIRLAIAQETPGASIMHGETHLWWAMLNDLVTDMELHPSVLNNAELDRAHRFRLIADRQRWMCARTLLRLLLTFYTTAPPEAHTFNTKAFGKPYLLSHPDQPGLPLEFNVSHSGNRVLIAFSAGYSVGVDVEQVQHDTALEIELAAAALTPRERQAIHNLPSSLRAERLFQIWTLKEAALKCVGTGLTIPPHCVHLVGCPSGWGSAVYFHFPIDQDGDTVDMKASIVDVGDGYVAAVSRTAHGPLHCFQLIAV